MLVPSPPGGSNDGVARILAAGLNTYLGRPIVIDNRAGGGGIIASELAARARADGYTLLFVYAAFTTTPFLQANINYDILRDFSPISEIADQAQFIAVNAGLPITNVQQLLAMAKSKPGGLLAGFTQPGGSTHLATEIFKLKTRTTHNITSVSYKGGAAVQVALAAGEVQVAFLTATSMLPQISTGKIRAIAVAAPKRVPYLPEVPTLEESGMPSVESYPWQGLLAPAGTPRDVINRLHTESVKTLRQKDTIERLATLGADPVGSTPEEFRAKLAREVKEFGRMIPQLGIRRP